MKVQGKFIFKYECLKYILNFRKASKQKQFLLEAKNIYKNAKSALAKVTQLIGASSIPQKVTGSIPGGHIPRFHILSLVV